MGILRASASTMDVSMGILRFRFFKILADEFGSQQRRGADIWRTRGLVRSMLFPVGRSVGPQRIPPGICGSPTKIKDFFVWSEIAWQKKFRGLGSDTKTPPMRSSLIHCRAACG